MSAPRGDGKHASEWRESGSRRLLLQLYARADALVQDGECGCHASNEELTCEAVDCCHFAVTGREPYPTAVELAEVQHAIVTQGIQSLLRESPKRARASLPLADEKRRCPLLDHSGRCRIYASRPLGCRTFFCSHANVRLPRREIQDVSNAIANLSASIFPRDPGPRPFVRALAQAAAEKPRRP